MDNISYKDKKEKDRLNVEVPKKEDSVGIRATLNNMGISNSTIGFNDERGTVTLGGKDFMKPKYYDDVEGITYSPENEIRNSLVDFYKNSSNPVVRVSDTFATEAGKYGLTADALTYGNGVVEIGGSPLDTLYIDDTGKAWAWQSDVSDAVENYARAVGAKNPNELYRQYADRYLTDIRGDIDRLSRREPFSYDPDSDPVYLAYKQKYLTEGNRASRNAMANYSALTGGYVNSAAATAGALASQYYAQQLSNTIPELAQDAYQRYNDSYNNELKRIDSKINILDKAYGYVVDANKQAVDNANRSAESNVKRDNAAYERQIDEYKHYWEDKLNNQKYESTEQDNYWKDTLNSQKVEENNLRAEGYRLDNNKQTQYMDYYRYLLEAELEGKNLSNKKIKADLQANYGW